MAKVKKCVSCNCFYNSDLYSKCPYCNQEIECKVNKLIGKTRPIIEKNEEHFVLNRKLSDIPCQQKNTMDWVEDYRCLQSKTILNNRYEIEEVIPYGGFGVIYKVIDKTDGTHKAIKEYFLHGVVNRIPGEKEVLVVSELYEEGIKRFKQEIEIMTQCQSSNVVRVEDCFDENNTSYMVMEYLQLPTLEERIIQNRKPLDYKTVIDIGVQICDELKQIHKKGFVHGDISPDNILINKEGKIKIIDFSHAGIIGEKINQKFVILKPGFAPIELYNKNSIYREGMDIYSLGATLYLLLTGRCPIEVIDRKVTTDYGRDCLNSPSEINASVPQSLDKVVMSAMEIEDSYRYRDIDVLKEELKKCKKFKTIRRKKHGKRKKMFFM